MLRQCEMVGSGGRGDKIFDGEERMRGRDIDGGEELWETWMIGEERKVEDEKDKAIFSTIVGER